MSNININDGKDSIPLFSILVPVYNVELYIRECLDSVLAQKISDYEVILVDDGSSDTSGLICDEYCSKYPASYRVIHKKNEGLISARRIGIKEARGIYCVFLDSDDMLEKDCLSSLAKCVSEQKYDIVLYNYSHYIQAIKSRRIVLPVFKGNIVFSGEDKEKLYLHLVLDNKINNLFIKMIRRELLQSDPTDYSQYYKNSYGEDLLQSLYPMTEAESIIYLNKPLYLYRIHESSMIRNFDPMTVWLRYNGSVDGLVLKYMHKWGVDTQENLEKRDACLIKNMIDTVTNHLNGTVDKTPVIQFADEFITTYCNVIERALKSSAVSLRYKTIIALFYKRRYRSLTLYYKTTGIILKLMSKR